MPARLGERLRAVDDKQTRHRWIEAPLDQVVDQCLHHSTVLSCPLHQSKRVLEALAIDPERSHQHEMLTDVDAVDLHHHDVEAGQIRTHPFLHARSRQRHEVPRSCRLRYSGPRWRGNIALGQPHRSAEFPRRYVDQHQVHRPLAEPVLRDRTLPTRQRQFMALEVAHAGPLNRHLASVEADLAWVRPQRCPRRPSLRAWRAPQASSASFSIIAPSASTPAAKQNRSKLADTSSHALPTAPISVGGKAIDVVLTLFMALLSFRGISTPSLPAQGGQRRFSYFNIQRGHPDATACPYLAMNEAYGCYGGGEGMTARIPGTNARRSAQARGGTGVVGGRPYRAAQGRAVLHIAAVA